MGLAQGSRGQSQNYKGVLVLNNPKIGDFWAFSVINFFELGRSQKSGYIHYFYDLLKLNFQVKTTSHCSHTILQKLAGVF